MSISHAIILTHDLLHRIKYTIHKDMVSILHAMNLLRDVLRLKYTKVKPVSPKKPTTSV